MGYDEQDVSWVTMFQRKLSLVSFMVANLRLKNNTIELHEYMNGLDFLPSLTTISETIMATATFAVQPSSKLSSTNGLRLLIWQQCVWHCSHLERTTRGRLHHQRCVPFGGQPTWVVTKISDGQLTNLHTVCFDLKTVYCIKAKEHTSHDFWNCTFLWLCLWCTTWSVYERRRKRSSSLTCKSMVMFGTTKSTMQMIRFWWPKSSLSDLTFLSNIFLYHDWSTNVRTIYRGLFTDEEWNVIDCALSEYQDHFDGSDTREEIIYNRVQDKISAIFDLTKGNWSCTLITQQTSQIVKCLHTMQKWKNRKKNWTAFVTTRGKNYTHLSSRDHGFNPEDDYSEEVRVKCYNGIVKYSDNLTLLNHTIDANNNRNLSISYNRWGIATFYKTLPTRPKTSKGVKHRTQSYLNG